MFSLDFKVARDGPHWTSAGSEFHSLSETKQKDMSKSDWV